MLKKRSKDTELTLLRKTVVTFFFLVFVFEAGGETPLDWQWNEPEVLKVCTAGMIRALALTLSDPLYGTDTALRNTSDATSSHVLAAEAHTVSSARMLTPLETALKQRWVGSR